MVRSIRPRATLVACTLVSGTRASDARLRGASLHTQERRAQAIQLLRVVLAPSVTSIRARAREGPMVRSIRPWATLVACTLVSGTRASDARLRGASLHTQERRAQAIQLLRPM